jgi:hypothetical protein
MPVPEMLKQSPQAGWRRQRRPAAPGAPAHAPRLQPGAHAAQRHRPAHLRAGRAYFPPPRRRVLRAARGHDSRDHASRRRAAESTEPHWGTRITPTGPAGRSRRPGRSLGRRPPDGRRRRAADDREVAARPELPLADADPCPWEGPANARLADAAHPHPARMPRRRAGGAHSAGIGGPRSSSAPPRARGAGRSTTTSAAHARASPPMMTTGGRRSPTAASSSAAAAATAW